MRSRARSLLRALGIEDHNPGALAADWIETGGTEVASLDPSTGGELASVQLATQRDYAKVAEVARQAFVEWRQWPAPQRGEVVRKLALELRQNKDSLATLVSLEVGKIRSEGLGEVQEMIDMADLAVGMSRQLYGKTMHSERPEHRMYEQWHPLGPVGIITAFNFPVAVWAWNAMVAAVCGNSMIWKPSLQAPLTALAVTRVAQRVLRDCAAPPIFGLVIGSDEEIGERLTADRRLPLVSATGSARMGRQVGAVVAQRLGRCLLELGGNNGIVVMHDADPDLTLRAVLFAAVGTAGQRCTTCRRLLVHRDVAADLKKRLMQAYGSIRIGDPLDDETLMGPLISRQAVDAAVAAVGEIKRQGGKILAGGAAIEGDGFFFQPTLVEASAEMPIVQEETFAPILYVLEFPDLDAAIRIHNDVPQGLSSAIFSSDMQTIERFLSATGSDCGIANANIGTSGAEIGGAFGGEKDTGGGREAGSDAWKAYMRRQTCTVNYSSELSLAQGVEFEL